MKTKYEHAKVVNDLESISYELIINNLLKLVTVAENSDDAILIEKYITFADVRTNRKALYSSEDKNKSNSFSDEKIEKRAKKNLGFYTTTQEIVAFEKKHKFDKCFFNQTKQNSIYVPSALYSFFAIPDPTKRKSKSFAQYSIGEYDVDAFICNGPISEYFGKELTQKTYLALGKNAEAPQLPLQSGDYTRTALHITPHGLGTTDDGPFEALRENVFARDKIVILCTKKDSKKKLYIAFFRNVQFFIVNDLRNRSYFQARYSENLRSENGEEGRIGQSKWRDELAELSMGLQNTNDYCVKCPFTGTKVKYPEESAFLRASHIKAYAKCKTADGKVDATEAYDINNGFLVTADVDALFDRYLLSVDPNTGEICKSPILSKEVLDHLQLKKKLDAEETQKKKKYLAIHYDEYLKRNGLKSST